LTLSFALGLLTKRQCFLANFCAANSKKDKKDEKKYCCDMCIIYNVPAIFVVGVLLLLIFLSGSMKMVSQRGKVYDFSGERMMNKMHHMEKMMCDKEDFKKHEGMGMMMRKHQISPAAKE
jgi:hypothetical protein